MTTAYYVVARSRRRLFRSPAWWWVVRHVNGQTILTSETYTTKAARDATMRHFMQAAGLNESPV